jgi:hypothetical protein
VGSRGVTDGRVDTQVRRTADLLRARGRPDPADALIRMLSAPAPAKPSVLVAGEAKVGKSSLVNALLSRPGLSPVGPEPTTSAPITFFLSERPAANVWRYGEAQPFPMELDAAMSLATVAGNPGNEENVRAVSIGVDSPLLADINLVDTPGVGGLDSGHGALTLQSLANADALVFVTDTTAPIRAAELDFLRRASARIDTVVLVLTKIDANRGWRTILEDDRAIIKEQAPRFANCPVVAVSSQLALRGLRSTDPEEATELRDESGLPGLERALTASVIARSAVLRDVNAVRSCVVPLVALERSLGEEAAAVNAPQTAQLALQSEQKRLQQLNLDRAEWPQALDTEVRKLTLERQDAASRTTVELRHRYDERVKTLRIKDHDGLPGEFTAELTALVSSLNEVAAARLGEIVHTLLAELDDSGALEETIERLTQRSIEDDLASLSLGSYGTTGFDKLSVLSSFSTGRTVAELVSGSGLGLTATAFLAPPVAIALGVGLGSMFVFQSFRNKSRQSFTSEFGPWMRDQISNAQLTINNAFSREMIDFQLAAKKAIREALAVREREINQALVAAKKLVEMQTGERNRAQQQLTESLAEVRSLRQDVLRLLAELARTDGAAPGGGAGAPS